MLNPGDNLQAALDSANAGDVLVLNDGTYRGSGSAWDVVLSIGKDITIRALNLGQAVLDGQNVQPVISCMSATATFDGVVITRGYTIENGGGIGIDMMCVLTINNCNITHNYAGGEGGGLYATSGASLVLNSTTLKDNAAGSVACALNLGAGVSASIVDSHILRNSTDFDRCTLSDIVVVQGSDTVQLMTSSVDSLISMQSGLSTMQLTTSNVGRLTVFGGSTTLTMTNIADGAIAQGGEIYITLPVPAGYYLPNALCVAYRLACDPTCPTYQDCVNAREACRFLGETSTASGSGTPCALTSSNCRPPTYTQVCGWEGNSNLVNRNLYTLPQGERIVIMPGVLPFACPAGYLGSPDPAFQGSPSCAGLCPAGVKCPNQATTAPEPCDAGKYCPTGTILPLACQAGSYSSATNLTQSSDCTDCPAGSACATGSTAPTLCAPGTITTTDRQSACSPCSNGEYQDQSGSTACESCSGGSYCPPGASAELPCLAGSYSSMVGLAHADNCTACPIGYACATGSTVPSPCAPGTISANESQSKCFLCGGGEYQEQSGSSACEVCTPGYYCVEGSAAPLPCPRGTHKNFSLAVMTSVDDCVICPVGTFCSVGSAEPTECAPGTYNDQLNASTCVNCAPGTYQSEPRSTACEACTPGYYCADRSAAPLPCPGGTHKDTLLAVMTSVDDCVICPVGTFCSIGSAEPTACAPGTYNNKLNASTCVNCAPGKYQSERNATACEICIPGFYCEAATAKPTPCPAGHFGNATGLYSARQCTPVPIDFWAPLGSRTPEACPTSGFYCPGQERDMLYGGAKPILMPIGQSTRQEEVPALTKIMTLGMSIEDYWEQSEELQLQLAAQYGIDRSLITLRDSAGSVQLTITIATSDGGSNSVDFSILQQTVAAVDDDTLARTFSSVMGVTVTVTSQPAVTTTVPVTVPFFCPRGKWCTAGLVVDCPFSTYNPLSNATFATSCILCPLNSKTLEITSTSRADCVCDAGFYDANASMGIDQALINGLIATGATAEEAMATALGNDALIADMVDCQVCPVGTACDRGSTLEALPLVAGYYRLDNTTNDVRECPDARKGCESTFGTAACESNSGCQGGVGDVCGDQLSGVYCEQCESSGDELVYYVEATEDRTATCAPCGNTLAGSFAVGAIALTVVAFIVLLVLFVRRKMTPTMWRTFRRFNESCTPRNKLKIVLGFYQLVTKVPGVYEVTLPPDVNAVLKTISVWASFGLQGVATTPLECMGLAGYTYRLLAYMLAPAVVIVLVVIIVVISSSCGRKHKSKRAVTEPTKGGDHGAAFHLQDMDAVAEQRPPNLFEQCLPTVLAWLFIVYPMVTKVAFDGFPCYSFEDGAKGYLRQDVSLECHTPDKRPVVLSLIAVLAYPIAIWLFCFALLFKASPAIISGKSTPLSRAIGFLYREYEVTAFWWELMEMLRKLLLVGVFVVVKPGSILQVSVGTIVCATYLMVQLQATPYKKKSDDYLAVASSFALLMVFFCSVIYKYDALTVSDNLRAKMSIEQKDDYIVDNTLLSAVLLVSVLSSLIFAGMLVILQIIVEVKNNAKMRRLKYAATGEWVECKSLDDPQAFHLFLSHAWPAAQDRMRIVKTRFLECLPSCKTFLDVDDLKSGSGTAEVDKSECILVFCTSQYFEKKNSLKELYRAVVQRRRILAMLEPDATQEGGLNQADVEALITNVKLDKFKLRMKWAEWKEEGELLPASFDHAPDEVEVRAALFATPPVEWNRLPHFQDVTIRLIAQNGILGGKAAVARHHVSMASARHATVRAMTRRRGATTEVTSLSSCDAGEIYMQGEAATGKIALPPPLKGRKYHLFCSPFNAGAQAFAEELKVAPVFVTTGNKASATLTYTADVTELAACDHMLVLLDGRTFTSGGDTANFIEHVHEAMRVGVHLNCIHEFPSVVGPPRHECEFGLFFSDDWTPAHLTGGPTNLYKEIAFALKGAEWRQPGLVAVASKLVLSAGPHKPINVVVPDTYEPATDPPVPSLVKAKVAAPTAAAPVTLPALAKEDMSA